MKRLFPHLALVALVLVTAPVMADAPIDQYEQFVGTTQAIMDTKTKLEWQRTTTPKQTWTQASMTACAPFGGRLPTVKELLTLVDEQPHPEYRLDIGKTVPRAIDGKAFAYEYTAEDAPYWTSTPADQPGNRWGVSFKDGTMIRLPDNNSASYYVRCVK